MTQNLENLINIIAKRNISYNDFVAQSRQIGEYCDLFDVRDISMWQALGLDITHTAKNQIELNTRKRFIKDQIFCIVDIETNGGIENGQIIEIGAIKLQNDKILDTFDTLVKADFIPDSISELTGIKVQDLANAPSLGFVLEQFKNFLKKAVFVAHNVKFDYDFISHSLEKFGFAKLLNRRICTIDLARRTIASPKYGLNTLKEVLQIDGIHHRALSDTVAATKIFQTAITNLPQNVKTVEDLIEFSKNAPTLKKPIAQKNEPLLKIV